MFGVLFLEKPRHGGDTGRNDTCVGWVWKFWKCGHPEGNPAVLAVDVVNIS